MATYTRLYVSSILNIIGVIVFAVGLGELARCIANPFNFFIKDVFAKHPESPVFNPVRDVGVHGSLCTVFYTVQIIDVIRSCPIHIKAAFETLTRIEIESDHIGIVGNSVDVISIQK
jgi:hypothetical protein